MTCNLSVYDENISATRNNYGKILRSVLEACCVFIELCLKSKFIIKVYLTGFSAYFIILNFCHIILTQ